MSIAVLYVLLTLCKIHVQISAESDTINHGHDGKHIRYPLVIYLLKMVDISI
jgi:hypothetical protein